LYHIKDKNNTLTEKVFMIVLTKKADPESVYEISDIEFRIDDRGITLDKLVEEIDSFVKAIGFHPPEGTSLGYTHDN
jgi:hypothetical protein